MYGVPCYHCRRCYYDGSWACLQEKKEITMNDEIRLFFDFVGEYWAFCAMSFFMLFGALLAISEGARIAKKRKDAAWEKTRFVVRSDGND